MPNHNASYYFLDRHLESAIGHNTVFVEADGKKRQITYEALSKESGKMVDFYARHSVSRETRAAMIVLDKIEFPIIFWGSLKAGIVPVAVNTLLSTDVYDTILRDSRAEVVFVSEELLPVVSPAIEGNPFIKKVFVIGDSPGDFLSFHDELAKCEEGVSIWVSADECAFWLYSSG
ncbi:MAG: AMP-binding protein, partial [Pseudomonadota bacterium]